MKANIRKSWATTPKSFKSIVDFHNWFDGTSSIKETVQQGQNDWENRLANFSNFKNINKNTCLEIGFGGGRLLAAASKHFNSVIGIDIHEAFEKTESFLKSQNVNNYSLIHRNDIEKIKDESIDFIYSFIVFQHFDSLEEVDFYLKQIKRIIAPNGYAHIYWGKTNSPMMLSNSLPLLSSEYLLNSRPTNIRDSTLFVGSEFFCERLTNLNFTVVEHENKIPKRINEPFLSQVNESGQARALFKINKK